MFSLCRLCATCTKLTESTVSELEPKLALCCGWMPSDNEVLLPKKACHTCVDQLQRSWNFVEQIRAAEKQLNKLLSEQIETKSEECLTNIGDIKTEDEPKEDENLFELEESKPNPNEDVYDDEEDVFGESIDYFDDESTHSNEEDQKESIKKNCDRKQTISDPFLAPLAPDDRLESGLIRPTGLKKLEKLFPDMKTMSWSDCQYKCAKCDQIIRGPLNLYSHIRSMHTEELPSIKVSCFYCGIKHRRELTLHRHIATEHFVHLKFRCTHCPHYYWNTRELTKHRNMHTDIEYRCEVCEQVFSNRDTMYVHCMSQHGKKSIKDPDEVFICDLCSKQFKTKSGIKSHLYLHSNRFDYICDQCGWKFQSKGNLKGHLASTHATDRPFKCDHDQCSKRFKTKHQMKNHSKIHDDVYNFTCDVCGRKFRRPYTLNVHMRSHTKICPYTCRFCGKSFPHNVTLQTHERAHINDKPHACTECSYRSTAKGNLNKHMMRAHSIDFRNHVVEQKSCPEPYT